MRQLPNFASISCIKHFCSTCFHCLFYSTCCCSLFCFTLCSLYCLLCLFKS